MTIKRHVSLLILIVGVLVTACKPSTGTPEEFLKEFYFASANDTDKVMTMLDSATLPPGDGMARTFTAGMVKMTQAQYQSHGGIESVDDIKTWTAKRDPKYTGYSLSLRFKDGKLGKGNGYLIQENGQWRMTTAANQG